MKICAIICEFNPFHNGHKYLLEAAKRLSGCDAVLCIMSGSFTQRGEICILDKYTRAKHAVFGGADCVIELPVCYAVAPAEIFAKGAIKILSAIPDIEYLAFGCESGNADSFTAAAQILKNESDEFKSELLKNLERGESYIRSYASAFEACGGEKGLLSAPNNILGVEYAKAALNTKIKLLPIKRLGAGYNENELKDDFSSASGIRSNLSSPKIKDNVPEYVYKDLQKASDLSEAYEEAMRHSLFFADTSELKRVYGCSEGLENRLKALSFAPFGKIISGATSKRYSAARISRILCANMLGLYRDDCEEFLAADGYIKVLAISKARTKDILPSLAKSEYPLLADGSAGEKTLSEAAAKCYKKDCFAFDLRNHIAKQPDVKDNMVIM